VAVCAGCHSVGLRELTTVDVDMAFFASRRRLREVDVEKIRFEIRGLMAIHASDRAMRSGQREFSLRVIEA